MWLISTIGSTVAEIPKNGHPGFSLIFFRLTFVHIRSFAYRTQSESIDIFDRIANIKVLIPSQPWATIHICSDFVIYHKEWLPHSNNGQRRKIAYDTDCRLAYSWSRYCMASYKHFRRLPRFLSWSLFRWNTSTLGYSLIIVMIDTTPTASSDMTFHRTSNDTKRWLGQPQRYDCRTTSLSFL